MTRYSTRTKGFIEPHIPSGKPREGSAEISKAFARLQENIEPKEAMELSAKFVKFAQEHHTQNSETWSDEDDQFHKQLIAAAMDAKRFARRVTVLSGPAGSSSDDHDSFTDHGDFLEAKLPDGSPLYGVRSGQRYSSIPGMGQCQHPFALGEAVKAIATGQRHGLSPEVQGFIGESGAQQGGYLVDATVMGQFIDLALPKSALNRLGVPTWNLNKDYGSMAKVTARPTSEVKAEFDAFTSQDFTLGLIVTPARVVGIYTEVSEEFLQDAPRAEEFIQTQLAKAMAEAIDNRGINDDGSTTLKLNGLASFNSDVESTGVANADWLEWHDVASAAKEVRLNDQEPTGFLLDTATDHDLQMTTDSQGRWLTKPPYLDDVTIAETTNCPTDQAWVGDFSLFSLALRSGFQLHVSPVGETFKKLGTAVRIYWRGNYSMFDATAFHRMYNSG